jgi:hypothetical protein
VTLAESPVIAASRESQQTLAPKEANVSKAPKHNKIRLVYRVNQAGAVTSFIHVEGRQAKLILDIFKFVKERGGVTVEDVCKELMKSEKETGNNYAKSKHTIQRIADKIAGVLWIDVRDESGNYMRLVSNLVDVQKGIYHKKRNLPKVPKFLKAPYFFVAART